jgi:hypothetical protein
MEPGSASLPARLVSHVRCGTAQAGVSFTVSSLASEVAEMRASLLLACWVWPAGFGASAVAAEPTPTLTGEIVLERASYCDVIVVRTEQGFSLIEIEHAIVALAGGHRVTGRLTESGPQALDIDGRTQVTARVKAWDSDLRQAKARFDRYCEPEWLDLGADGDT